MSWISIDDEVGAILHALTHDGVAGPVNLTGPTPVRNAEFTKTLGRVLGRPTVLPTPLLPLRARYGSELVQHLLVEGQRVLPKRLEATGYAFEHPTLEDALRAAVDRH
jgi:NAD dependent epimerase/dehydratase family enzyme